MQGSRRPRLDNQGDPMPEEVCMGTGIVASVGADTVGIMVGSPHEMTVEEASRSPCGDDEGNSVACLV